MNRIEIIKQFLAWVDQNTDTVFMEYEDYEYHYSDESALVGGYIEYLMNESMREANETCDYE